MDTTQVETNRLLTDEEIDEAVQGKQIAFYEPSEGRGWPILTTELRDILIQAQDAKTLKAVGEWLEEKPKDFIRDGTDAFTVEVSVEDIGQLKQGKMP